MISWLRSGTSCLNQVQVRSPSAPTLARWLSVGLVNVGQPLAQTLQCSSSVYTGCIFVIVFFFLYFSGHSSGIFIFQVEPVGQQHWGKTGGVRGGIRSRLVAREA